MATFGETSLRNIGSYLAKNASMTHAWDGLARAASTYRSKYISCRNARATPFWHAVFFCMAVNYYLEYPHLKSEYDEDCFGFFFDNA